MKYRIFFNLAVLAVCSFPVAAGASTFDSALATRMHGRILLQVEEHGEAWYVRSKDSKRYYMKDGTAAYSIMRFFSQGITDADLAKIPSVTDTTAMKASSSICASNALANRMRGQILLQVQQHGEAWYVDSMKCRKIYMKDGAVAYEAMRFLGLGILNSDLIKIEDGGAVAGSGPITPTPTPTPISNVTVSQKNAVAKAKSYLGYTAFSHDGLVAQLEYEQFSHADAVYGADNSGANWNEQAAKKAKSYMEYSAFSRGSLIAQLEYDKFTQSQAEYGANAVGL